MVGHGGHVGRTSVISVLVLGLVLCVATLPGRAGAWGFDGHHATCLIAESLLQPATLKAVRSLLPEYANGSLASLCLWPDEIKRMPNYHWTYPLHYIDTPDLLCSYDYERDCYDEHGNKGLCASGAINNFTSQLTKLQLQGHSRPLLRKAHETEHNFTEALLFLSHIVGDIHQPLHVGFTSDGGGNTVLVEWYTHKTRLHHIWDDEIIERAKDLYYNKSLSTMVDAIMLNITNNSVDQGQLWSECSNGEIACPDTYATEGVNLACQYAYRNAAAGSILADEYFLSRLPIVESRLAQGGVRLAAILNRLFSAKRSSHRLTFL
ncbi:hypothetical protein M758_10G005900 [Ceratodon purpureus]|uniref:Aspergillus nuclease S1 n=1 Tax=Ceratodon purpureus TaxID=3225 RepID=A0A8T0GK80_CERPU|nr:hypothetical protein KC19_10G006600 [Ceratodon purpureus]KAG0602310.1 hypothetical protein M758_10G005900 [Ceratodon purpureus]